MTTSRCARPPGHVGCGGRADARGPGEAPRGSDGDPDRFPPQLARESVDRLAPDGRATAVLEAEPPAVERADGLAVLDPAVPQVSAGVRAAAEQGVIGP